MKEEDRMEDNEGPDTKTARDTLINFFKGLGDKVNYSNEVLFLSQSLRTYLYIA